MVHQPTHYGPILSQYNLQHQTMWKEPETIVKWILIALGFVCILVIFLVMLVNTFVKKMVENKARESQLKLNYQQELLHANIKTQENERQRIAEDIHDGLIGQLTVLKLQCDLKINSPKLETLFTQTIQTAREISHDLCPPMIGESTLLELVETLPDQWSNEFTIQILNDIRTPAPMSTPFKLQFYRICQEMINNAYKYASCQDMKIQLRLTQNHFCCIIKDDGIGFETTLVKKGLGMKNLESRTKYLQGNFKIKSTKNEGTRGIFYFPITP